MPLYINKKSNLPLNMIKAIPEEITEWISDLPLLKLFLMG